MNQAIIKKRNSGKPEASSGMNSYDKKPELLSLEECKEHLGKYNLSDQEILNIRDNLTGIVDSIINSYLDNFK
jgi:hypothetical protein